MSNPPMLDESPPPPDDRRADRLAPGERVITLWWITLMAVGTWLFVGATYASVKLAAAPRGTPTTQIAYTPYETAVLGVVLSIAVIGVMVAGNALVRPGGGLARLGLSLKLLPRGVLIGLLLALLILPLVYFTAVATEYLWRMVGMEHPTAHPLLRIMNENGGDPLLRALIIFSATLLAPLSEEMLFRGHLQTAILYTLGGRSSGLANKYLAIVITSLVFTLFHGELWMMPPIFLLALCLGWVYERTRNLWASIVVHACFNGTSIFYFLREMSHH